MPDKIVDLKVGISADINQLIVDLKDAEKRIAALGSTPVKITVAPDVDAKSFSTQVQKAVGQQSAKISPKIDITDASGQLATLEKRMEEIKQVAGNVDVSHKIYKKAGSDEISSAVIRYTNAVGQAISETYKLVNIFDDEGNIIDREFRAMGETLSDNASKVAKFKESLRGVGITLDTFATKNADIADQIGMKELLDDFEGLKQNTNAEVVALQRFKNEFNAVKAQAAEIRAVQKAEAQEKAAEERQAVAEQRQALREKAAEERQAAAEQRQALREQATEERQLRAEERQAMHDQAEFQQTLKQLRSVSSSNVVNEQRKITDLYKKQLEYINRRIAVEKSLNTSSRNQAVVALQLQKATLRTVTYKAKLATYAKDVADQITRAKNNMSGLQGYSRSTANIFKGIILSQTFYNAVGFLRNLVNEAWELSVALNTSEAVFTGMLTGGQEQAQGLLEVLKQEAINTPFDINNLLDATRLLTAYGIKAENLLFVMQAVEKATAVSGDPVRMEYISRALGQIYTKGKLQSEEVRQLTESGIAVGEILADELNLTQEQIAKGWGNLGIDANTAINAIVRGIDKRYGTALDNMARTTEQKINNMKESFALITSSITDPIRRGIDSLVDYITPKIEKLYQAIQAVGLGNALKSLIPERLYNSVLTVINKIVSAFQTLKIVIQQLKPVLEVLFNAFAWRLNVIYNIFTTILAVLGMVGNAFGGSAKGLALLESGLKRVMGLMLAYKAAMLLVAAVSKIWNVVSIMLRGVILAVQGVIVAVKGLAAIMGAAGMASASAWLPVIGVLLTITGLVAALAGSLGSVTAAAKRVGAALKNMGGGTSLGEMFENVSSSLQTSVDAYNAEVAKQNESMNNALIEGSNDQTTAVENAGGTTEKAMKGLMSFDEVYKLNEASAGGGGGGAEAIPVEIDGFTLPATGGLFDGIGGIAEGLFEDLNLDELQNALGDLWSELQPLLDNVLLYVMKMVGYFAEMHLKAKLMTSENKEQWTLEKQQTSEDTEQAAKEKQQTTEDTEQAAKEKAQTSEDTEQLAKEKSQTTEDTEQLAKEKAQTAEDIEQAAKEKSQTSEDTEQLVKEKSQTSEDSEQLVDEKLQTAEDKEQLVNEKLQTAEDKEQWTITKTGGAGVVTGGTGQVGTAAALALINIAQIGASAKSITDDIKTLKEGGASLSDWMALFVDGLMMAVDALQLFGAFKLIKGAIGGAGGKAATVGKGVAKAAGAGGGAASAGESATGTIEALDETTGKMSPKLASLAKNLAMGLVIIAEVAAAAVLITGAIWALGKILVKVGEAWEPVITNGPTILTALGAGTAILVAVGALTALLGSAGTALITSMALGMAVLAEVGIATGLFVAEVWALGWGLEQVGEAWQPVLDNGDTIVNAIALGSAILLAVGVACAALGAATVATAGALPLAIAAGTAILLEMGVAAGLFVTEIWAIGKGLDEIGKAWQPVLANGETIADAIALGTALLIAIGVVAAALGVASVATVGLLPLAIAAGTGMLLELSASAVLFIEGIEAIGEALVGVGEAWGPVLDNGVTVENGIARGTELLIAIGVVAAALGTARVASVGLLDLAIDAGTDMLGKLADAFVDFTGSLVDVATDLKDKLAPALKALNKKLPDLSDNMSDFTDFMTKFANQVVRYTEASAIAALSGLVDKIIGWFTDDPFEKLAKDVEKIKGQAEDLNAKLRVANPELETAYELLTNYQMLVDSIGAAMGKSNQSLPDQMFFNLKEAGKNLVTGLGAGISENVKVAIDALSSLLADMESTTQKALGTLNGESSVYLGEGAKVGLGFATGISNSKGIVKGAMQTVVDDSLKVVRDTNKTHTGDSTVYKAEGEKMADGMATGINNKASTVKIAFKTVLNSLLSSMEIFTNRVATTLNATLSRVASTMSSVSTSSSGKVSFTKMSGVKVTAMANGGVIHRAARGIQLLRKPTMLTSNTEGGEAGDEIVFPLENTSFIQSFAEKIAEEISDVNMQASARSLNAQMKQAKAGATQAITLSSASADDISNAIRSWFTPQMQSLHNVLEEDRTVEVTVPNTSNALWRTILSELKAVNESAGSRGLSVVGR